MTDFLRFDGAQRHQPAIDAWLAAQSPELRAIARVWFEVMRGCGPNVTELLHDAHPTACVGDAAFGYVNVFTSHVQHRLLPRRVIARPGPFAGRHGQIHAACEGPTREPSGRGGSEGAHPGCLSRHQAKNGSHACQALTSIGSSPVPSRSCTSRYMVPLIFETYADDLAARVVRRSPKSVLEIAAGTGVVTRRLANALPHTHPSSRLISTRPWSTTLRAWARVAPWCGDQADASQLPFADESFDVVVCQFGAMFFPDKPKAYSEARRVLREVAPSSSTSGTVSSTTRSRMWSRVRSADVPENPPRFMACTHDGSSDPGLIARQPRKAGSPKAFDRDAVGEKPRSGRTHPGDRLLPGNADAKRDRGARRASVLAEATDVAAAAIRAHLRRRRGGWGRSRRSSSSPNVRRSWGSQRMKTKATRESVDDLLSVPGLRWAGLADCKHYHLAQRVATQLPKMWGEITSGKTAFSTYTYESGRSGEACQVGKAMRARRACGLSTGGRRRASQTPRQTGGEKQKMGKALTVLLA